MSNIQIVHGVRPEHIKELNLETECESAHSGSLENVEEGIPILDGFHVVDGQDLVGWAVIFRQKSWRGGFYKEAHFFVDERYRFKGIGRQLFQKCKEREPEIKVAPWNSASTAFFNSVGA